MFLRNTRNRQSQDSIQMKFKLVQVLCVGKRYHTRIVRTRRKFWEIYTVFVTQEEFNSPDSITSQSFCYLCCHSLSFGKVFGSNVCRLETFTIVATFLYMSDRRAEQGRTILLSNRQQSDFTIELDKLFDDEFLDVTTAAFTSVRPWIFQIFRTFSNRLSLTWWRHQRFNYTRITNLFSSLFQFVQRFGIIIFRSLQAQFLGCKVTDSLTVHRKVYGAGTRHYLDTFFLQMIKTFGTDSLNFRHDNIRMIFLYHTVECITIQHIKYLTSIGHLHGGSTCIRITCDNVLAQTLSSNNKFLS